MGVQVGGHGIGEADHGVLGQVVEEVSPVPERIAVGHLDDESGIVLDHQRRAVTARDDMTEDGALEQLHAPGRGQRPERRSPLRQRVAAPDVVDQNVQPTLFVADAGEELPDLGLNGVVGAYGDPPATLRGHHLRGLLDGLGPPGSRGAAPDAAPGAVHGGPRRTQHAGDAAAGAARRAGDDGHPVEQKPVRHGANLG